ncbi:MAG TPA: transposase [Candidatus Manganitrophaceae bacterium]|nr:transposase [Candidatus Manganitrophaceae bacterium]
MARLARAVIPGIPHHITQRGNRRQETFFSEDDYCVYLELMAQWCGRFGVEVWAYCLMPNHSHLIVVPQTEHGLRHAIGEAHRRYTRQVNFRQGWRGHLWQGRFGSFPMDEKYLLTAARYIELNPVKARLAISPEEYPWSSAAAHLAGSDDILVKTSPLLRMVQNWREFLSEGIETMEAAENERHERNGRPLGSAGFVADMEAKLGRTLSRKKPGPQRMTSDN